MIEKITTSKFLVVKAKNVQIDPNQLKGSQTHTHTHTHTQTSKSSTRVQNSLYVHMFFNHVYLRIQILSMRQNMILCRNHIPLKNYHFQA
jgi:hypothetical protein